MKNQMYGDPNAKVKIIPLGGLDQIGMNITVIETEEDIVIVDCGIAFPDESLLGIDLVIPDVKYLKDNFRKIRGFVFTHGHEDHIGAIPYILRDLNVPIYATKLTLELIKHKLDEAKLLDSANLHCVNFGDTVKLGKICVEFIRTNHSIVDASALAIYTKAGIIMHTGDYKVDYTPVYGDAIDLKRFAEIGSLGVLAMLSDSTNAIKSGFTMSEKTVGKTFDQLFAEHKDNRIIVSTFASNVDRVRQVIDTASKYERKVAIDGKSMVQIIEYAQKLGYISIPAGTLITVDQLKNYKDEKTVIITTGSQGESLAALSRMASGEHKKIIIKQSDVVILSSTPIPGNEKSVNRIINDLCKKHAKVIYHDTHVSGHACEEEIKLLYTIVQPQFAIPVHGEYRHRLSACNIATDVGVKKENCLLIENGDVLELSRNKAKVVKTVQAGGVFVDGLLVGDVGRKILEERESLGKDGIVIVICIMDKLSSKLMCPPEIVSRGFIYEKDSLELKEEIKKEALKAYNSVQERKDWKKVKETIVSKLNSFLDKKLKRKPFILPHIMEI